MKDTIKKNIEYIVNLKNNLDDKFYEKLFNLIIDQVKFITNIKKIDNKLEYSELYKQLADSLNNFILSDTEKLQETENFIYSYSESKSAIVQKYTENELIEICHKILITSYYLYAMIKFYLLILIKINNDIKNFEPIVIDEIKSLEDSIYPVVNSLYETFMSKRVIIELISFNYLSAYSENDDEFEKEMEYLINKNNSPIPNEDKLSSFVNNYLNFGIDENILFQQAKDIKSKKFKKVLKYYKDLRNNLKNGWDHKVLIDSLTNFEKQLNEVNKGNK